MESGVMAEICAERIPCQLKESCQRKNTLFHTNESN